MTFKDRKERAAWELNGCRTNREPRKTLKISTPGNSQDDFQLEVTPQLISRMDEMRVHLTKVTAKTAPPRTKFAAALIEAAWQGLQDQKNIKAFTVDYQGIRTFNNDKTPMQKLAELSEHLEAQGVEFPSRKNGPSCMTATLRVLIECTYDAMKTKGSFKVVEFDYMI